MPKLSMEVSHALGREEAARRLKEKFAAARAEHEGHVSDFQEQWEDHTFTFAFRALGMAVSGTVAAEDDRIRLAADLPFAAMLFKGPIEDRIRQEVDRMLASDACSG